MFILLRMRTLIVEEVDLCIVRDAHLVIVELPNLPVEK